MLLKLDRGAWCRQVENKSQDKARRQPVNAKWASRLPRFPGCRTAKRHARHRAILYSALSSSVALGITF